MDNQKNSPTIEKSNIPWGRIVLCVFAIFIGVGRIGERMVWYGPINNWTSAQFGRVLGIFFVLVGIIVWTILGFKKQKIVNTYDINDVQQEDENAESFNSEQPNIDEEKVIATGKDKFETNDIEIQFNDEVPKNKICPICAEEIKFAALVCRYCGNEFDEREIQAKIEEIEVEAQARLEEKKEYDIKKSELLRLERSLHEKQTKRNKVDKSISIRQGIAVILIIIAVPCLLIILPSTASISGGMMMFGIAFILFIFGLPLIFLLLTTNKLKEDKTQLDEDISAVIEEKHKVGTIPNDLVSNNLVGKENKKYESEWICSCGTRNPSGISNCSNCRAYISNVISRNRW